MSTTSTASSSPGERRPPPVPERPSEVVEALRRLGVRPDRALGQSFLVDRFVADALAALAEPASGGPIVEIGGGLGLVTRALLDRGVRGLTVVERDRRLAHHLEATFGAAVSVRCADARHLELPAETTVVGSLPYAAGTAIVLGLLRRRTRRVAVLLQKEVAERFAAGPGSRAYGRPSILARLYGEPELLREVAPEAFYPVPRVRSRLWTHTARVGALPVRSVDRLEGTVRRLFASRRKQLGNLLPGLAGSEARSLALAQASEWPSGWERMRPEQLPAEAYFRLAETLDERRGTGGRRPTPTRGPERDAGSRAAP